MGLGYSNLMGPVTPGVQGGYKFIAIFRDDYSRIEDFCRLKTTQEVAESVHLYNMTAVTPLGLRIHRLQCDKRGEPISKECKQLCVNFRIDVVHFDGHAPTEWSV